ncbi:hypothetical protein [Brachybacterium paraconglomeratum]|uniref:hypothetical protein n=1 Tax=Brachybacterium paraconglomeratum TaxID=173362 RepID=UPI00223C19F3|nr:hypothetical protein [Brachybacterium paraconglomeratum]MCT1436531.1 hypothetical protein [Brachybacterium paraconglomeratum]
MGAGEWPRHDNKEWQEVIDRARKLGWPRPEWTSNHPALVLECPENHPQCKIRAYSTGKGTETVAKQSLRKVDRCPHRNIVDELATVDDHLDAAERFIGAAETLHARGVLDQRIDELLALAAESIASAEQALIDQEFDEVMAERDSLDADRREAESPVDLLDSASTSLRNARLQLRDLPGRSDEVRSRQARLDELTARRDGFRDLLHGGP